MEYKAMSLDGLKDFNYVTRNLRPLKNDEILVKVEACGICGSDIPRVYELGTRVYPVVIGHEFSATVVRVNNEKDQDLIGKTAAIFPVIPCGECDPCHTGNYAQCVNYSYLGSRTDGGFAEYCIIPSRWNLVLSENENIDKRQLAMTEPATVSQHAVRRSGLQGGETIVIIGAGPIGVMAGMFSKIFGARNVVLLDIVDEKIEFAKSLGFDCRNSMDKGLVDYVKSLTNGLGAHRVIEGTGSSAGLETAINIIRPFGTIALLGNPNKDVRIKLDSYSNVLRKELNLSGIWNSYYEEIPLNEWKYTVKLLDEGTLNLSPLISHETSLKDLGKLFDDIYEGNITIMKAMYNSKCDEDS